MDKFSDNQMLEIILREFKEFKNDWKEYKKEDRAHREKINEIVTRHDERIKNIWKIPAAISGAIGIIIGTITFIISIIPKS